MRDLINLDGPVFIDEQPGEALTVFRPPSRPDVSTEELIDAAHNKRPYRGGIWSDYRPLMKLFLDALLEFPGDTWQARWDASRAEDVAIAGAWHTVFPGLSETAKASGTGPGVVVSILIRYDALRPGAWFLNRNGRIRLAGFIPWSIGELDDECPADGRRVMTIIRASTGKHLEEVTLDDLLAFSRIARKPLRRGAANAWEAMKRMGLAPMDAPSFWQLSHEARPDAAGMVKFYEVEPPEVAEMFTRYLRGREAQLDYSSLRNTAYELLRNFWRPIRELNPDQSDLNIPPEIAQWWKQNYVHRQADSHRTLFHVRALYLEISYWASHDPYWAQWSTQSFVAKSDTVNAMKLKRRVQAKMHQRIRTLTPDIPRLLASVDEDRDRQLALLDAALATTPDAQFLFEGVTYTRIGRKGLGFPLESIPIRNEQTGEIRAQARSEDKAFWAWATTHLLHQTGIRLEELLELTATALSTYQLPSGERLLLLQIVPSKTDEERVILVSPELAHVLATVRQRVRGSADRVPLAVRYDDQDRTFSEPLPFLLQAQDRDRRRVFSHTTVRGFVNYAVEVAGIANKDIKLTPHDFRRIFATDAIRAGLPVHILSRIMGHLNVNTTQGYVAVFDEDVARHFREFVDRRRALRPAEDYREPTPHELEEFQQHFAKRKVELGSCARGYGTPCIHEHACIRCPMLRPDPAQRHRLEALRANLVERRGEATRMGWRGELEGIEISLRAADEKLAQMSRIVKLTLERRPPGPG